MSDTVSIKISVKWQDIPGSTEMPLRFNNCTVFIFGAVPFMQSRRLDVNGCCTATIPTATYEFIKQYPTMAKINVFLSPNTEDCDVVYREHGQDKYNTVTLVADLDFESKEVNFLFHLNPVEGETYADDPKTWTEQCDRRRLVVASILQLGAKYIRDVVGRTPKKAKCYYPKYAKLRDNSYDAVNLHLCEDDYLSPSVILHEYGHEFFGMFKNYYMFPYRNHHPGMDLSVNGSKTTALYTAFVEGFATFFSKRVAMCYSEYLEDFSDYNELTLDENYSTYDAYGESCEGSITSLLCDMVDSYDKNDFAYNKVGGYYGLWFKPVENLSLKDKDIIDMVEETFPFNIYEFTKVFYKKHAEYKEEYNNLLSIQGIAPSCAYLTKNDGREVTLNWKPGGTEKSRYFDNDGNWSKDKKACKSYQKEFDVSLYDANYHLLKMFHVKDKNTLTFKYDLIKKFSENHNYCLVKIKGYSYQRINTEYESSYFRIDLKSYYGGKGLTLLPSLINDLESSNAMKTVKVGSLSFSAQRVGMYIEEKGNLMFGDKNYCLNLAFNDSLFDNVRVEFETNPHDIREKIMMEVTFQKGIKNKIRLTNSTTVSWMTFKMDNFSFIMGVNIWCDKAKIQKGKIRRITFFRSGPTSVVIGGVPNNTSEQSKPKGKRHKGPKFKEPNKRIR